jgi:hypothetical protein
VEIEKIILTKRQKEYIEKEREALYDSARRSKKLKKYEES